MNRRILNLGAGTQSSVLLVMADRGEIEPVEVAIFADTQAEPREVYEHLDWLEKQVKIPIVRVSEGNLEADSIAFRQHRFTVNEAGRKSYASIPLFILNPDGSPGMVRRQCTYQYKIMPIERYIRRSVLGLKKGQRISTGTTVTQVYGISFDERNRAKNGNGDPKSMRRSYPLVDMKLTRGQVIALAKKWFPDRVFPRSACVFCPYHSDAEWRRMQAAAPDEWERAVKFDHAIRDADQKGQDQRKMLVGAPFVHAKRIPLDQVDLRTDDEKYGQLTIEGFANECDGMCGV